MSDPHDLWLADAVEAARECARDDSPAALEGAATRSRIHASLERRRGTSKRRLTIISAIVASMFGSTAFAYYSGWRPFTPSTPAPTVAASEPTEPTATKRPRGRASKAFTTPPTPTPDAPTPTPNPVPTPNPTLTPTPLPTPTTAAPTPRPMPTATAIAPTPTPTPKPVPTLTARATPAPLAATTSTSSKPKTAPRVAMPSSPPTTTSPSISSAPPTTPSPTTDIPPAAPATARAVPDAELAAYQRAHDAHFRGTDAKRALAAWDAYLAQFPAGKLAPEARYDRALVLVKLGRWADARTALQPFASAPAGAYRQREAAKILDAIRGR